MNFRFLTIAFLLSLCPTLLFSQINDLPRSTPEAEGIESAAINRMFDTLQSLSRTDIHHIMIVRNGKVVAELHPAPFKAQYVHTLYSGSKTFTSMAIGFAIAENRLRLNDRVASFFPEKLPSPISENLANMTVRNLLTMTSGITPDWEMRNYNPDWIKGYLGKDVKTPGTRYQYDSLCSFMLSAIVQKVTGMTMLEYLKPRLFEPLNISDVDWEISPDGINTGGWGVRLQAESQAKLGIALLNNGIYNGVQVIPASWVKEAISVQVDNTNGETIKRITDSNRGYGYQIRQCKYPGAFRADGAYGQFIVSIPDKNMVVVINGICTSETDKELDSIWNILMPGVNEDGSPIALNKKQYQRLVGKWENATLPMPKGNKDSKMVSTINGKTIVLEKSNHSISSLKIDSDSKGKCTLTLNSIGGESQTIPSGFSKWEFAESTHRPPYSVKALSCLDGLNIPFVTASAYAWSDTKTLNFTIHHANFISTQWIKIELNENNATITISENFSSNSKETIKANIK